VLHAVGGSISIHGLCHQNKKNSTRSAREEEEATEKAMRKACMCKSLAEAMTWNWSTILGGNWQETSTAGNSMISSGSTRLVLSHVLRGAQRHISIAPPCCAARHIPKKTIETVKAGENTISG